MTPPVVVDTDDGGLWGHASATFSPGRIYRYALTRQWGPGPVCVFVMLNPSTADAFTVDPTVRRCLSRARGTGHGGLLVLNIFALRSTDPRQLYHHPDPVGPLNDEILAALDPSQVGAVYAAWGAHGKLHGRGAAVTQLLRRSNITPVCLGTTKDGHPRHPLYVAAAAAPVPYAA